MLRIAIIIGSTRPNRIGDGVAKWVFEQSKERKEAQFELVDLLDFNLPLLDEPTPAGASHHYTKDHTKQWSQKVSSFDAFIFVAPEYNHGISGALKNAIDFLYQEWNNKVAGFVSYGGTGGTRMVEQLRLVMAELQVATVRTQVALNLRTDFEQLKIFKPASYHQKTLHLLFDQVISWGEALKRMRQGEMLENIPMEAPKEEGGANLHH